MDYTKYADKARVKIAQYGNDVEIIRKADRVYDKETHSYISQNEVISGKGLLQNIDSTNIDGTVIQIGDVRLMCVLDKEPKLNDVLYFADKEYSIVKIDRLSPDGTTVIYYNLVLR